MRKFTLYAGNLMAAVMDAGIGMLITSVTSLYFGITLTMPALMLGAFLALLPDLDLVPSVLRHATITFDHRQTLLHRPLLLLPVVTLFSFWLGGTLWAIIAFTCVLWHFLHDTNFVDDTYGVAWLWPFSNQFWSVRGFFEPPVPLSHEEWLKKHWLRPTDVSLRELGIGAATALVAGKLVNISEWEEALLLGIFMVVIIGVWVLADRVHYRN